jgi:hypothetical protein
MRLSEDIIDRSDAPFGNAYERDTPSRSAFVHSNTTVGTGFHNDGYDGVQGLGGRPVSWVSAEGESRYVQLRASELGLR